MDKHTMNQQESLQLIAEMIQQSKRRFQLDEGKPFLIWGYTALAAGLLVWLLLYTTLSPWAHLGWLLIPLVGTTLTRMLISSPSTGYAKTYTDTMLARFWIFAGALAWAMTLCCAVFHYFGYPTAWKAMLIYGLLIVGLGHVVSGIILSERSIVVGGSIATLVGTLVLCIVAVGLPIMASWFFPLYGLAFVVCAIVPGHVLNAKARRQNRLNAPAYAA